MGQFLLQSDCQRLKKPRITDCVPPNKSHVLCPFFQGFENERMLLVVRHHKGRIIEGAYQSTQTSGICIWWVLFNRTLTKRNFLVASCCSFIPPWRTFCSEFFLLLPHTPHLLLVPLFPFNPLPPPTTTTILLCLRLIKISKIQMAAGWLLSGNLPLIITGGDAWGKVGGAETNGKLDFFTELEWGGGIHILTSHQQAVDQEKCFWLVGDGSGKLAMMLRGILIRYPQPPPGCRQDQTHLHLLDQIVERGQDGGGGGGE